MTCRLFIGTSGWNYDHWGRGVFYPSDVRKDKWLEFYSEHFNTVEINSTFYRTPQEKTVAGWYNRVKKDFLYTVKVNRFITHIKKLQKVNDSLDKFFEVCKGFKDKLGPLLFQFPPSFEKNSDSLHNVFKYIQKQKQLTSHRLVFEFRHKSWITNEIIEMLESFNAALCFSDHSRLSIAEPITADFVYLRRHGPSGYDVSYSKRELREDAGIIRQYLNEGKTVYAYFNNDIEGHAVRNAKTLIHLLEV